MKFLYTFFCLAFSPMIFAAEESKGDEGDLDTFFHAPLMQHGNWSISTGDVGESEIYQPAKPLNLVFIHPYDSVFAPCIGLKLPGLPTTPEALMSRIRRAPAPETAAAAAVDEGEPMAGAGVVGPVVTVVPDAEFFLLIHRPMDTGPMLMRPHYWASKDLPAAAVRDVHINVHVQVINYLGMPLANVTGDAYAHGSPQVVCSPSNMPIGLDMRDETSHLFYSLAEKTADKRQALTCHWIPTAEQWRRIYETEFSPKDYPVEAVYEPSFTTKGLVDKFSFLFGEDPFWNIVKRNFLRS